MSGSLASFFNWPTLLVILAAILDIFANILLAASDGFRHKSQGLAALALVAMAFYCLSLAVRKMDLAVAYALWGSFGILGTSFGGWIFFHQKLTGVAFAGLAILITGMLLLRI